MARSLHPDVIVPPGLLVDRVELAAEAAGSPVTVPFAPGRMDASQEQTDVASFAPLEPRADAFRNWIDPQRKPLMKPEEAMVDKAALLGLTGPELTVLLGGLLIWGFAHTLDGVGPRVGGITAERSHFPTWRFDRMWV